MSAASAVPVDSKSAKKRKAKAELVPAPTSTGRASPAGDVSADSPAVPSGLNGLAENSYLKELSKNIRNLSKKINASAKADAIVAENPDVPLDDLVAQKKLNNDQRTQVLKKPQLLAQLTQLEEQQKHFQAFAQELEDKFASDKAAVVAEYEQALSQAKAEIQEPAETSSPLTSESGDLEQGLKVVTGFLHAAAARRLSDDTESEEARAFEGALLLVYQGNSSSLSTLKSLVEGSDEKVPDVEGNPLDYTFAQVKEAALNDAASLSDDADATANADSGIADVDSGTVEDPATDPTVAHAGLTELEDTNTAPVQVNGDSELTILPIQTGTGDEAANAVAEANWDLQASTGSGQTGDEWVQVPRDLAETETGLSQPAPQQSTSNWAEEAGAAAEEKPAVSENDGFEQVRRDRGGRGRGPRGRGFDGRGRGRGRGRGEGYRGRGGPGRGGQGGQRGDRPPQQAS